MQKEQDTLRGAFRQFCRRLRTKHLCALALLGLAASLVPLLLVARYSYPIQDDFAFSTATRHAWVETGSLPQVLAAAARVSAEYYTGWQGSYAACFLFALQPAIFGTAAYAATTWLMLASLLTGTFCFVYTALRRTLGADNWNSAFTALVLCIISVQQVPNPNQAFYWYNGAVYYTFFHGLMLLFLACLLRCATMEKRGRPTLAAAALLGIVVGGGNYVSGLVGLLAALGLLLVTALRKNPRWKALCLPVGLLAAGFAASMAAPGNGVRAAMQAGRPGLLRGMLRAFAAAFTYTNEWCWLFLLLALALLAPFFWRAAGGSGFAFRLPLLVTAGSVCLLAAAMFPHIYATGAAGPDRLTNVVFYLFVLLCAANLLYWLGWLRRRLEAAAGPDAGAGVEAWCKARSVPVLALAAAFALVLVFCPGKLNRPLTSLTALSQLRSGEAAAYGAEMQARYAIAQASPGADLEVPPIQAAPSLLAYGRLYDDPGTWDNEIFAAYFYLSSIREVE